MSLGGGGTSNIHKDWLTFSCTILGYKWNNFITDYLVMHFPWLDHKFFWIMNKESIYGCSWNWCQNSLHTQMFVKIANFLIWEFSLLNKSNSCTKYKGLCLKVLCRLFDVSYIWCVPVKMLQLKQKWVGIMTIFHRGTSYKQQCFTFNLLKRQRWNHLFDCCYFTTILLPTLTYFKEIKTAY